jgi:hypothetical protein
MPFFDNFVTPKSRHPLMAKLKKLLEEDVGKPCKAYEVNCCVCRSWTAFLYLDNMLMDYPSKMTQAEKIFYKNLKKKKV